MLCGRKGGTGAHLAKEVLGVCPSDSETSIPVKYTFTLSEPPDIPQYQTFQNAPGETLR